MNDYKLIIFTTEEPNGDFQEFKAVDDDMAVDLAEQKMRDSNGYLGELTRDGYQIIKLNGEDLKMDEEDQPEEQPEEQPEDHTEDDQDPKDDSPKVTLREVAKELKMDSKTLRKELRESGFQKKGSRWIWNANDPDLDRIKKEIRKEA